MMSAVSVAMFSVKPYDRDFFSPYENTGLNISYFDASLSEQTVSLAEGHDTVCVFVNDVVNQPVLEKLKQFNIKHVALRCAGFNNVDLDAARSLGIKVSRVPAYAPEAVAEHSLALMLALGRKLHKAYNRVKEDNFSLSGLLGFTFSGKTAGIVGTGKIGSALAKILHGMGMNVLCHDPIQDVSLTNLGLKYVDLSDLMAQSDVISLHCPLTETTQHLIDTTMVAKMKTGVMLINTSRGGLVDTAAVIAGLKSSKIGHLGLDVYEMESELFFKDLSCEIVQDDQFQRLMTFPNVLITGHQGFFTKEALTEIASSTVNSIVHAQHHQGVDDCFLVSE